MSGEEKVDLRVVQEQIAEIRLAPLAEHSVRFATINQALTKKLQEIESN